MKFRSMHIDTDRILSLSAMVIGVGSLVVIVYQTHLMRQSQHASVMPYLVGVAPPMVRTVTPATGRPAGFVMRPRIELRSDSAGVTTAGTPAPTGTSSRNGGAATTSPAATESVTGCGAVPIRVS